MPELPEVERAAKTLRAAIAGRTIDHIRLLHPSLQRRVSSRALRSLRGVRVQQVERRGKHQLVQLEDGRVLHIHFRLNGDWVIGIDSDPLPRFARALMQFTDGTRVVLEDSRALSTFDVHARLDKVPLALGPEPQDTALTPARLHAALSRRRVPIKVALLDQQVIAGLGNIYASEALWRARVDPQRSANQLSPAAVSRLLTAIRDVIARATGGRYSRVEGARLDVYDREGKRCRRCGTAIRRIRQAGRSSYFCPRCQCETRGVAFSRAPARRRP
jgi:formamidopyrimidine-DNA glycosylase